MPRKLFQLIGEIGMKGTEMVQARLTEVDKKARKMRKNFTKLGKSVGNVGAGFTKSLTLPLAIVGGAVIKFGADFEKTMTNSLAIMGDLSDSMKNDMEKAARSVAKTTKFSATQAAEAYYFLASAGLDAAQSIAALPQVAAFAQAGNFDLAEATDLLTDAQSALGLVSKNTADNMLNMTRVSDVLVKANTLANASVKLFSEALTNKAGAALRILGKDIEEGAAVLAVYADQGVKGAEAGSQLNIVLRDLQKASIKNRTAFEKAGIAVFDANGEMNNMAEIIEDLENRMEGMSDEQKRIELTTLGFTDKSISATIALLGTSDSIKEYEKSLRSAAGTTQTVADKQIKNFWDQLGILKDKLIDLGLTLWDSLGDILLNDIIPIAESMIKKLERLVNWFGKLPDSIKSNTIKFIALAAAIGPILFIVGKLILGFRTLIPLVYGLNTALLANPFTLVLVGIAAVGAAIWGLVDAYNANIAAHQKWTAVTAEKAAIDEFTTGVDSLITKMQSYGKALEEPKKAQELLGKEVQALAEKARGLGEVIEGTLFEKIEGLIEAQKKLKGTMIQVGESTKSVKEQMEKSAEETNENAEATNRLTEAHKKAAKAAEERLRAERKANEEAVASEKKAMEEKLTALKQQQADYYKSVERMALESNATQLDLLELQEEDAIKNAEKQLSGTEKLEKAKQLIREIYAQKRKNLEEETQNKITDIAKIGNAIEKFLLDERVQQFFNAIFQMAEISAQFNQNKIMQLEEEAAAHKNAIEQSAMNEAEKAEAIKNIDDKLAKKKLKLQRDQAKKDKALAIFQATINTAAAIAVALNTQPIFLGIALAIIAGILGAVQIAAIATQPLPFEKGAFLKSGKGGLQGLVAEGKEDEIIFPLKTGVLQLADALINKLSEMTGATGPRVALAAAGPGTSNSNVFENHWHIGTLVADDDGIKELERRMLPMRNAEAQRKGED